MTKKKGPVVAEGPPRRRWANDRGIDWASIVERLRAEPGKSMLFEEMTGLPHVLSVYHTVKGRRHSDLRLTGERVIGNVRDSSLNKETGRRTGDLWLTLVKED